MRPLSPVLLCAVVALVTGCAGGPVAAPPVASDAPTPPEASPRASPATSPAPAVEADLEALLEAFERHHPEPPDLAAEAEAALADLDEGSPGARLVAFMRLTATRDRDGHTGVFPLAQGDLELWPLRVYGFDDPEAPGSGTDWRVIAAAPPYEELVGRAVTGVGGRPIQQVVELLEPLVPHDNAATVRARLPQYLVTPAVLRGLGVEGDLELDGGPVTLEAVPTREYAGWARIDDPLVCPSRFDPDAPRWDLEERDDAVVVRYRRVLRSAGRWTAETLADELLTSVGSSDASAVVFDLRGNPGGDSGAYRPLREALETIEAERPGTVRLLLDRCTFSAATNLVAELVRDTSALTVGETMGGSPAMWGDARRVALPSGIGVHVATRVWEYGGSDAPVALEPDVAVPVTWEDHVAGRDPALEAALSRGT